jgi:hypothetical protein
LSERGQRESDDGTEFHIVRTEEFGEIAGVYTNWFDVPVLKAVLHRNYRRVKSTVPTGQTHSYACRMVLLEKSSAKLKLQAGERQNVVSKTFS